MLQVVLNLFKQIGWCFISKDQLKFSNPMSWPAKQMMALLSIPIYINLFFKIKSITLLYGMLSHVNFLLWLKQLYRGGQQFIEMVTLWFSNMFFPIPFSDSTLTAIISRNVIFLKMQFHEEIFFQHAQIIVRFTNEQNLNNFLINVYLDIKTIWLIFE